MSAAVFRVSIGRDSGQRFLCLPMTLTGPRTPPNCRIELLTLTGIRKISGFPHLSNPFQENFYDYS